MPLKSVPEVRLRYMLGCPQKGADPHEVCPTATNRKRCAKPIAHARHGGHSVDQLAYMRRVAPMATIMAGMLICALYQKFTIV